MIKRLALAAGILALLLVTAVPAASPSRTRNIEATIHQSLIETTDEDVNVYAGRIRGRPAGRGATLLRARGGEGQAITHTARAFYGNGSIRVRGTGTAAVQADGTITFSGEGEIVGGTGRYRDASGRYTFEGTQPAGSSVQTVELEGRINY